jgi:hypothetical protein
VTKKCELNGVEPTAENEKTLLEISANDSKDNNKTSELDEEPPSQKTIVTDAEEKQL